MTIFLCDVFLIFMVGYFGFSQAEEWLNAAVNIPDLNGVLISRSVKTGVSFGVMFVIYLAVILIPSSTSTILKFRKGVIPSLKSEYFGKLRSSIVSISSLMPSGFWAAAFSGV